MISVKALLSRIMSTMPIWTRTNLLSSEQTVTNATTTVNIAESVDDFAFIEIGLYSTNNYCSAYTVPTRIIKSQINGHGTTQTYFVRVQGTNYKLYVSYITPTQFIIYHNQATSQKLHFYGFGRLK